jgi:hypothetical protein
VGSDFDGEKKTWDLSTLNVLSKERKWWKLQKKLLSFMKGKGMNIGSSIFLTQSLNLTTLGWDLKF